MPAAVSRVSLNVLVIVIILIKLQGLPEWPLYDQSGQKQEAMTFINRNADVYKF